MPRSRPSPQYQSAQPPVAKPRTKLPPSEKRTRSQSESGQPIPKPRKNSSETDPSRSPSIEEPAQDGAGYTQEPAKDQNLSVGSKPGNYRDWVSQVWKSFGGMSPISICRKVGSGAVIHSS